MKKLYTLITFFALIIISFNVSAQNGFSELIKSGPGDATKLVSAYAEPLFKGFGVGMNSGWNNTAKTKKPLHFDLRISATAAFIPAADKTFDVTKIGLSSHVAPNDPNQTIAQTIGGDKNATGPLMNIYDNSGRKVDQFTMPSGKIPVIPTPQVQLTMGVFSNTDVTLRAIPSVNLGSNAGSVSMIGVGVKHDILQDFVGKKAKKLIPWDLAIAVGYNHTNMNMPLTVNPEQGAQPADNSQSTDFSNQHVAGHFNSFMAQAIVSKKLAFFTPFLAVGYNTATSNVAMIGNYPVTSSTNILGQQYYVTLNNPVTIKETSISGMRADIGFQINAGFFRIFASYSAAQYHSANAGIGFGF